MLTIIFPFNILQMRFVKLKAIQGHAANEWWIVNLNTGLANAIPHLSAMCGHRLTGLFSQPMPLYGQQIESWETKRRVCKKKQNKVQLTNW